MSLMSPDDVQRRGAAVLEDRHQGPAVAVAADHRGLRVEAVADLRHVAEVDHYAAGVLDGNVVEGRRRGGAVVEADGVLLRSDAGHAGRQGQVVGIDRIGHVLGRDPAGLQQLGIQIHHHLPLHAAIGRGHGQAPDHQQPPAELPEAKS